MVPHADSIELLEKGFINCRAQLFLRENMTHNNFCYTKDIIEPFRFFVRSLKSLEGDWDKQRLMSDTERMMRRNGYVDETGSRYFNNYQARFRPSVKQQESSILANGNDSR